MTFTDEQTKALQKPLAKSRVKQRSQSGRSFSYIEGYDVIDTANSIFGFDGWSMSVESIEPAGEWHVERNGREVRVTLYQAVVAVTVGEAQRMDVGHGITASDTAESRETAIKGAVTDAMKRALRTFGAQFGNSLYDKDGPELAPDESPMVREAKANGAVEQRVCPTHKVPLIQGRNKKWGHVLDAEAGTVCYAEEAA